MLSSKISHLEKLQRLRSRCLVIKKFNRYVHMAIAEVVSCWSCESPWLPWIIMDKNTYLLWTACNSNLIIIESYGKIKFILFLTWLWSSLGHSHKAIVSICKWPYVIDMFMAMIKKKILDSHLSTSPLEFFYFQISADKRILEISVWALCTRIIVLLQHCWSLKTEDTA